MQDKYKDPCEAVSQKRYQDVLVAGAVASLLPVAEALEASHYRATLDWWKASAGLSACGGKPSAAKAPPSEPHLCQFLEAFRAAAREAFPILGIKIDADE